MRLTDQEDMLFEGQTFDEEVLIRYGARKLTFNSCIFNKRFKQHLDGQDQEDIHLINCTFRDRLQLSYFGETGISINTLIDNCFFDKAVMQIWYNDYSQSLTRRTKGFVLKNCDSLRCPTATYLVVSADNPIIENNTATHSGGAPDTSVNTYQINGCLNPIVRGNLSNGTVSTTKGDGHGIIIDWAGNDEVGLFPTEDALVEGNICIGSRSNLYASGINNYQGVRSVIRKNILIDNNIGTKFNRYDDYHAYANDYIGNDRKASFHGGATDRGYI